MRHVILNLHGLGTPPKTLDPGEDRYWVAPDLLAVALDLAAKNKGRVRVDITFDDGNRSDIEIGAPLLEAAGWRGCFFVLADRIGQPHYLSAEHLRELVARGHRIGSHGAAHIDWTGLDDAGFDHELVDARASIAAAAGQKITEAGIPFGRYNARVLRALRRAGYGRAYSSDGGAITGSDWPVPRTSLTGEMNEASIEAILLGQEPLKRRLQRRLAMAVKARL